MNNILVSRPCLESEDFMKDEGGYRASRFPSAGKYASYNMKRSGLKCFYTKLPIPILIRNR